MAIITSFFKTPQAGDDYYSGYTEDWQVSQLFFDVMRNDLWGKAKTLYSLDDGTNVTDLLTQDTTRSESASSDYSAYGAKIWITSDGKVGYDLSNPIFQNKLQSLAVNETLVDHFTYAIRLGNGALSWATTYVEFSGLNDAPIITSGGLSGSVIEQITPMGNITTSGEIIFRDVDLSDTHSICISPNGTPIGSTLGSLTASLVQDSTNGANGKLMWTYSVDAALVEYLAAGQPKIESFNVSISDGKGGVVRQKIDITIEGTNDAPVGPAIGSELLGTEDITLMIPVSVLLQGFSDIDAGSSLSISNISASNGQLTLVDENNYSFTPDVNFNGNITLSYDVIDGQGGSVSTSRNMNFAAVNDAVPIANAVSGSGDEDTSIMIVLTGTDVDGDIASFSLSSLPENGILYDASNNAVGTGADLIALSNSVTLHFVPTSNFNGDVSFNYTAKDSDGAVSA